MNVWLWGPPLWEVLHASTFLLDAANANATDLLSPLSHILPCRYCRESFAVFYAQLGDPKVNESFRWTFDVHNLVNRKLEKQRVQKYLDTKSWPKAVKELLLSDSLASAPTLEVVRKRQVVNSDDSVPWAAVSTALLAVVMGLESSDAPENVGHFTKFLTALDKAVALSTQKSGPIIRVALQGLMTMTKHGFAKCRLYLERLKYGDNGASISAVIKAGYCFDGTCK